MSREKQSPFGPIGPNERDVVRMTDRFFYCDSPPEPGQADCLCSRCGKVIPAKKTFVSFRFERPQPALGLEKPGEYRYCNECEPADGPPAE